MCGRVCLLCIMHGHLYVPVKVFGRSVCVCVCVCSTEPQSSGCSVVRRSCSDRDLGGECVRVCVSLVKCVCVCVCVCVCLLDCMCGLLTAGGSHFNRKLLLWTRNSLGRMIKPALHAAVHYCLAACVCVCVCVCNRQRPI